ncbi:MAG: type II secretion system protein GspJ [bacterium]
MILNNRKGFTLVEVMISLLISSVVVIIVYTTYRSCIDTYEREKNRSYLYQDVKMIIEYLQTDIHSAFVGQINKKLVFIGRDSQSKGMDADSLELTTTSSFETDKNLARFPLRRVKYFLSPIDDKGRDTGLQRVVLWGEGSDKNTRATLGPLVTGLKFRYYDGVRWMDAWGVDEKTGEPAKYGFVLPQAVEVTLTLEDPAYSSRQLVISKFIPVMAGYATFYR